MTKEEFEAYWLQNMQRFGSETTLELSRAALREWLYANGFECIPCDCGADGCQGWRMHVHIPNLE